MKLYKNKIGIGVTKELSMRVSVGVLVRLLFINPETGNQMLALERTATLSIKMERPVVIVKAKPFGGGVQLINPLKLKDLIGNFHYDSERSYQEGDFRILINPAYWGIIKEICKTHLNETEPGILDSSPENELAEEFEDSLKFKLTPDQYNWKQQELIIEDLPLETDNTYAQGLSTVRVYYISEARIISPEIILMMMRNSRRYTDKDLHKMAIENAKRGGKGRANAILILDKDQIMDTYYSIPLEKRSEPVYIGGHQLSDNVPAILDKIKHPRYQRYLC
jgi:hypothetical protein